MLSFFTAEGARIDESELDTHDLDDVRVSFHDGPPQPMRILSTVELRLVAAWLELVKLDAQRDEEGSISLAKALRGYPLGTSYADVVSGRARRIFEAIETPPSL